MTRVPLLFAVPLLLPVLLGGCGDTVTGPSSDGAAERYYPLLRGTVCVYGENSKDSEGNNWSREYSQIVSGVRQWNGREYRECITDADTMLVRIEKNIIFGTDLGYIGFIFARPIPGAAGEEMAFARMKHAEGSDFGAEIPIFRFGLDPGETWLIDRIEDFSTTTGEYLGAADLNEEGCRYRTCARFTVTLTMNYDGSPFVLTARYWLAPGVGVVKKTTRYDWSGWWREDITILKSRVVP